MKRQLETAWGAKVGDHGGDDRDRQHHDLSSAPPAGGTHIIEDHFIEETLEYEGDRPGRMANGRAGP